MDLLDAGLHKIHERFYHQEEVLHQNQEQGTVLLNGNPIKYIKHVQHIKYTFL